MHPSVARHADAAEAAALVQAGALVLAGVRVAFIDVHLASGPGETTGAIATERARRVDAETLVFTREALGALVHVFCAVDALEAVGA